MNAAQEKIQTSKAQYDDNISVCESMERKHLSVAYLQCIASVFYCIMP